MHLRPSNDSAAVVADANSGFGSATILPRLSLMQIAALDPPQSATRKRDMAARLKKRRWRYQHDIVPFHVSEDVAAEDG